MTRFDIVLSVEAEEQADARDLADKILQDVRVRILKGGHPGIGFDNHITVAQPAQVVKRVEGLPVRTFLPEGPGTA